MRAAVAAAWLLALAAVPAAAEEPDRRSQVVLRLDCENELRRREVTLFGNGTLRLRDGPPGGEVLSLVELGPEELAAVERRLAGEDLSETDRESSGVTGDWIERCELEVERPGAGLLSFSFGRYDALSLALSRVVAIARELGRRVDEQRDASRLPSGYVPRPGDLLRRVDDRLFRVVGLTADRRGVELRGVDQPLTLYVAVDDLRREFLELVSRRRR